jgi:hypothetical protein
MRALDREGREVENWAAQTCGPSLNRPALGRGKGRPSGDLAGLPSGSASSLLPAANPFAVARKSPYGLSSKTSGRGGGQVREKVNAILLSCARRRPPRRRRYCHADGEGRRPSRMMLVHRTIARRRGAPLSGSIAYNRSSGVERFDQSAAGVGPGARFFEAVFDCPARRPERGVEFVARIAFGDS